MTRSTLLLVAIAAAVIIGGVMLFARSDATSVGSSSVSDGVRVDAPGTTVESSDDKTRVQAPGVDITVPKDKSGD